MEGVILRHIWQSLDVFFVVQMSAISVGEYLNALHEMYFFYPMAMYVHVYNKPAGQSGYKRGMNERWGGNIIEHRLSVE